MHRNDDWLNTLWTNCSFLSTGLVRELQMKHALVQQAQTTRKGVRPRFNSAEGCYSKARAACARPAKALRERPQSVCPSGLSSVAALVHARCTLRSSQNFRTLPHGVRQVITSNKQLRVKYAHKVARAGFPPSICSSPSQRGAVARK
eukprot:5358891-Pleurochrysis_carterae.AAC.1